MKKILLISGGFDSLLIAKQKEKCIDEYVYLDYNHIFKDKEVAILDKIEQVYNIKIKYITIKDLKDIDGFFLGRNLHFFITVREAFEGNICVYFGNNCDDNYSDNTREFISRVEKIINDSYPDTFRIICPLENLTKQEIVSKYV